jgi:hypothetical protein
MVIPCIFVILYHKQLSMSILIKLFENFSFDASILFAAKNRISSIFHEQCIFCSSDVIFHNDIVQLQFYSRVKTFFFKKKKEMKRKKAP